MTYRSDHHLRFDILIIGSGPGGSVLAGILASQGRRVLIIDRGSHPRFAIGESSTPIADRLLRDIGERYGLKKLQSLSTWGQWQRDIPQVIGGKKRGFSYFWHDKKNGPWQDDASSRLLVAANADDETSDTQWYRPSVDRYLVDTAQEYGSEYWDYTDLTAIRHVRDHWVCSLKRHGTETIDLKAEFIVDASGQGKALAKHLHLPDLTSRLHTCTRSTYTHVSQLPPFTSVLKQNGWNVDDYPFDADDAAQHHLFNGGWLWSLRFQNGVTSVGWTRPFSSRSRASPLGSHDNPVLREQSSELISALGVEQHPRLIKWLSHSQLSETPGRIITSQRLQHWTGNMVGKGYALLPTSAATLDPLHSTGLAHTLSGVARLANVLLAPASAREARLFEYAAQVQCEVRLLDRLLSTAYLAMSSMDLFTAACMLYFAVAIRHEELRQEQRSDLDEAVWGADQPNVRKAVSWGCELIRRRCVVKHPHPSTQSVRIHELMPVLRSLCAVPLYTDGSHGLYGYTFAEK